MMIFYFILFLIILAIIIWGGVTRWQFISKNKEGFKKYNVDLITHAEDKSIPAHRKGRSYVETQKKW